MKNFTRALLSLGLLAGVAAPAIAADYTPEAVVTASGLYLRGDAGWSWLSTDEDDDSVLVLGGGLGYQFNDNLRTDLRVDWADDDPVGQLAALWARWEPELEGYVTRGINPSGAPSFGVPGDE